MYCNIVDQDEQPTAAGSEAAVAGMAMDVDISGSKSK